MPTPTSRRPAASFRDLDVWNAAMDLVVQVYAISSHVPKEELYGLTSQMRRAAVSIPSNIAEGRSRLGVSEYRHFISIARGSLAELDTELELTARLGLLDDTALGDVRVHMASIGRMLTNLAKSLRA